MRQYNRREGLASADDTLPVDSERLKAAVLDRRAFSEAVQRLRALLGWPAG
ncbi:hypothetical protein [Kibdelosporangium aridum]|uniref:Uncharacterized protein n=1 Tax=Kibdelosporangium aridum TaxID=2030 RepID=A0A1W2FJ34_KIBAR|nr:hypothetical protein [Kibdelosporangium aridum]SMD21937.1 hypothetical protein SAMN05661093_07213 [Kibdelosporangium aridum]